MSTNRSRPHDPLIPSTLLTVGGMIEAEVPVTGYCSACQRSWPLDLPRIAERRGPHWTLFGRKLRCPHCRREASIMAKWAGGFTWPIGGDECANYTAVRIQRRNCPWCNKAAHG